MTSHSSNQRIIKFIRSIFSQYYLLLGDYVKKIQTQNLDEKAIGEAKIIIENAFNKFWNLSEFSGKDRETYFDNVQKRLKSQGYYLDMTPQYGIDTKGLNLETVDNISLRPILKREKREVRVDGQKIAYTEFFLGKNLISVPDFIEPIIESASPSELTIFLADLRKTLDTDYEIFKEYGVEADKRFVPGELTENNLFCIQLKLHERQWGKEVPDVDDQDSLIEHFRLHGEQHILDFHLLNSGKIKFDLKGLGISENLAKDAILEARVLIRQLLGKSLTFYTLGQIIIFERDWMGKSRSEYAIAGHMLFDGFVKKMIRNVTKGIEELSEDEIYRLVLLYADNNKNFSDISAAGR